VGCYIWYSEEGPGRAAAPSCGPGHNFVVGVAVILWCDAVGLQYARTLMFSQSAGDRQGVQNFILLITAGVSNNRTLTLVFILQLFNNRYVTELSPESVTVILSYLRGPPILK